MGQSMCKPVTPTFSEDCISRQAAIESVADEIWHYPNECYKNLNVFENAKDLAEHALRGLPPAQPEIIRCKDCKFASGDSRRCMKFSHSPIGELDFCAWAERRTDE